MLRAQATCSAVGAELPSRCRAGDTRLLSCIPTSPGTLGPLAAPRGTAALWSHLTGVHVRGQLEASASVAVAGVAPRGVDAGLLTAALCTLVHICHHGGDGQSSARAAPPHLSEAQLLAVRTSSRACDQEAPSPGRTPRSVLPAGPVSGLSLSSFLG